MLKKIIVSAIFGASAVGAFAITEPAQPCAEIRIEISKIVGLDVTPSKELLQKIGMRSDCEFTSEEVYRAVAGDKPKPLPGERSRHHSKNHEDDDD